ncbi:MAG: hypothetical protein PUH24_01230 [Prevotellaceae bacterium]|nr:hypothetical protein [Prevotellaceae bacterium]
MKQLSKLQSVVFLAGGIMMVAGAGMFVFGIPQAASWIFLLGAIAFAAMQMQQCYDGGSFVIRRLRRIMLLADVCFVFAGVLMVENAYNFFLPLFIDHLDNGMNAYIIYVMGKWVVFLLIAAILEVYATHRISNELDKENNCQ